MSLKRFDLFNDRGSEWQGGSDAVHEDDINVSLHGSKLSPKVVDTYRHGRDKGITMYAMQCVNWVQIAVPIFC